MGKEKASRGVSSEFLHELPSAHPSSHVQANEKVCTLYKCPLGEKPKLPQFTSVHSWISGRSEIVVQSVTHRGQILDML